MRTYTEQHGPYHVDDVADPERLAEIRQVYEDGFQDDGYVVRLKFVGVVIPDRQDIATWNADFAACDPDSDPVCSTEYTRALRWEITER